MIKNCEINNPFDTDFLKTLRDIALSISYLYSASKNRPKITTFIPGSEKKFIFAEQCIQKNNRN